VNTIAIVFNAEFTRRIRSRAFFAGTVIGAVGILAMTILPLVMGGMMSSSTKKIVLVGPPALTEQAKKALAHDFEVSAVLTTLDQTPTAAFLDAHGKASAVAILAARPGGLHVTAYTREPSLFREAVDRDLARLQIALALGVPPSRIESSSKLSVDVHDVSGRFADADAADAAKGVAFLFVILLYLSILLNAQAIMTSVAEEKTNRIAELLVATIDPSRLLTAKILAAAATSVIQLGAWVATGIVAGRVAAPLFAHGNAMAGSASGATAFGSVDVTSGEIVAFVAFFAVGFAQYAVLYAAAASLINRTEDIGTVTGPLVIPVVIAFFLAIVGMQAPNSPSIVICSMIPLISPFVMFTRVAVTTVPAWQLVVSLALNVGMALLLAWVSGKIYRVGLLLYGRPPSVKQILATLRT
jgi:ABC-2 type transport system permease protein